MQVTSGMHAARLLTYVQACGISLRHLAIAKHSMWWVCSYVQQRHCMQEHALSNTLDQSRKK